MALAKTLTAVGTVALARCGGRPFGTHLFSVWPGAALAATAFPVRCAPGDNLALHVAVAEKETMRMPFAEDDAELRQLLGAHIAWGTAHEKFLMSCLRPKTGSSQRAMAAMSRTQPSRTIPDTPRVRAATARISST